ncbi:MAG: penicillin-binding protein 2 [Myxococcales bacterium]|nr:penicillin-binding protein 2 [Myxococcales bacterium]
MTMLSVRREVGEFRKRYKWMALFVALALGGVVTRLIHLQLIEQERWKAEAQDNITKHVRLPATRGIIRDREGKVIASNRPAYELYMTPQLLDREDIDRVADLMKLDADQKAELIHKLEAVPLRRRSHLIEVFDDISRDQYAAIETHRRELPGVQALAVPVRDYPFKDLGAHAVGFLNEVNAEDLERAPERHYRAGDWIGRSGIERAWESYLRGRDGELEVVVDVRGREFNKVGGRLERKEQRREPVAGRDLRLTLDMGLMRGIERAFRGHPSGAAVVVEVNSGRVRALFSKPTYDLNEMSGRLSRERYEEIEQNPFRPLIDKTLYESYFPGSTFKPISALSALEDNILTTATRYECPGYYELGKRKFRCSHVHGDVDMRNAIVQSCNVFFYRLAEQVGLDRLGKFSRDFGLGQVTGIGINTEARGFVPTREWYKKRHGDQYRLGFTLNAAIGQGNTRVTLIQLAMAYAAIANGGTLYVPQLVRAVEAPDGSTIEDFPARVRRRVNVSREHLTYVIDGMFGVVNDQNGTAYEARVEGGVPVAGKTGTAQVARRKLRPGEDPRRAWYYRRSHAWFAGFAPADAPELVAVVLVEHGGHGGKYAAPIATRILQEALGPSAKSAAQGARKGRREGGKDGKDRSFGAAVGTQDGAVASRSR